MNIKIETEDENFAQFNNQIGKLSGTYTKDDEQYVSVKLETETVEIPRKFCKFMLGKPLTKGME